ncbi:nucleotidyltransferase [Candidatus Poribacteria bacterium]|nr:nucleotidyltransferase [Candidatus Poribacteria bacterium]
MGTGIEPLPREDYDIDVGLIFHLSKNDYSPIEVKKWVYEALHTGNRTVKYKRPCVRVQYHRAGEELYHVDLAIYAENPFNWDNRIYLAKGFPGSAPENQIWEPADPRGLIENFQRKFQGQDGNRDQFRRIIRYLKRWKDVNFSANGNARPTGIAITACAMNWFQIGTRYNISDGKNYYDDLTSLKNLAQAIINQFDWWTGRMSVCLPVSPRNNLFEKMSDKQMEIFKSRLEAFRDSLSQVELTVDTLTSCHILQEVFGGDFPTS